MSKILLWAKNLLFLVAFLWVLFTAGFLQEFARDGLPAAAEAKDVPLPLKEPWLMVRLQRGSMYLMDGDVPVKGYDIGMGEGAPGRAGVRGRGTPLGEFTIANKLKRENIWKRGSRFLPFHYPREEDAVWAFQGGLIESDDYFRILDALRSGEPAPVDTPLGGPIGIQGNYFFFHSRRFTDGSIAMSNADLNELFDYVQPGMRVVIEDY